MLAFTSGLLAAASGTIEWVDVPALIEMISRFMINVVMVWVVVHFFYYPKSRRRDYYFTFLLFAVSIFMLIYLMDGAKMKIGAALGLFAVFGIIRYRTESVPIREMTYLFFLVALSVVNGMAQKLSIAELAAANVIFVIAVSLAESNLLAKHVSCKYVRYDNIKLITPDKREEMYADLEKRLGVKVLNVEIGSVDFLKDSALIKVYYQSPAKTNSVDDVVKFPRAYSD
ncbi:MAG: DUF4956 domain-containing protein [Bacteroidaceae bacterium]|nr:DUF4956 domain-containing protein [Bacteroidaceae bacterium]